MQSFLLDEISKLTLTCEKIPYFQNKSTVKLLTIRVDTVKLRLRGGSGILLKITHAQLGGFVRLNKTEVCH